MRIAVTVTAWSPTCMTRRPCIVELKNPGWGARGVIRFPIDRAAMQKIGFADHRAGS